jgi:hypothetical protein
METGGADGNSGGGLLDRLKKVGLYFLCLAKHTKDQSARNEEEEEEEHERRQEHEEAASEGPAVSEMDIVSSTVLHLERRQEEAEAEREGTLVSEMDRVSSAVLQLDPPQAEQADEVVCLQAQVSCIYSENTHASPPEIFSRLLSGEGGKYKGAKRIQHPEFSSANDTLALASPHANGFLFGLTNLTAYAAAANAPSEDTHASLLRSSVPLGTDRSSRFEKEEEECGILQEEQTEEEEEEKEEECWSRRLWESAQEDCASGRSQELPGKLIHSLFV